MYQTDRKAEKLKMVKGKRKRRNSAFLFSRGLTIPSSWPPFSFDYESQAVAADPIWNDCYCFSLLFVSRPAMARLVPNGPAKINLAGTRKMDRVEAID
jgi:hypothetical protein